MAEPSRRVVGEAFLLKDLRDLVLKQGFEVRVRKAGGAAAFELEVSA